MKLLKTAGIALDEAALVTAMVAGAGTFATVAIDWNSIGGLGLGQNLTPSHAIEQLEEIARANNAFYDRYSRWPHEISDGEPTSNASVLISRQSMNFPYSTLSGFKRLVPEEHFSISKNQTLMHSFGNGGEVTQEPYKDINGNRYIKVTFHSIPLLEAQQIDTQVDGAYTPETGKITIEFPQSAVDSDQVAISYLANKI